MRDAWFEYNGVNSLEMNLKILNEIAFPSPEADVEFVDILGKDGEVAVDNERLKNVSFSIPVQLRLPKHMNVAYGTTKLSEWLKSDIGWHKFRFSAHPEYEYQAMFYEQFDVKETISVFGRTVLTFKLKPIKTRVDNMQSEIANGQTLINPHTRASKPFIYIEGSGAITLRNNGVDWLKLNSIDGNITIDSETMTVYKGTVNQFDKMISTLRPLFPILTKGENVITWTGNVTKLEIDPRWRVIV